MELNKAIAVLQERHAKLGTSAKAPQQAWAALEGDYNRLLSLHPDHPALLFGLGTLYSQTDRVGAAIALLQRSADCGSIGPEVWLNMANAHKIEHRDSSAADCYDKATKAAEKLERENAKAIKRGAPAPYDADALRRARAEAMHGMASLYVNAGKPEKVIEWADKALQILPDDRHALWNKGLGLLEMGRFKEGFALYDEAGFMTNGKAPERKVKTYGGLPQWKGIKGQTVICYGEQGRGDEEMFASMLPDLMRECRVIIDCDPRLEAVFRRSFPQAEAVYPTSEQDAPFDWIKNHKVDAWVAMGSLGRFYRPDFASFPRTPYLKPDLAKVVKWGAILGPARSLRVGVSWAGGLRKTRFDKRSIPLIEWAPILQTPGVEFYSFQYHQQSADEAADVGNKLGVPIHHWGDAVDSYEETLGLLANMDLVITVNTSLLHTCGAMGVPTLCLTPVYCAWRYQCEGPMPWYGSVEMYRQEVDGEWRPVLEKVRDMLAGLASVPQREAA